MKKILALLLCTVAGVLGQSTNVGTNITLLHKIPTNNSPVLTDHLLVSRGTNQTFITPIGSVRDIITGSSLVVTNIAALKAINPLSIQQNFRVCALGFATPGDGGGGFFTWQNITNTADGGRIVAPNSGFGRWTRDYANEIDFRWYGATPFDLTDDHAAITNAIANAVEDSVLCFWGDEYRSSKQIDINKRLTIKGYNGFRYSEASRIFYTGTNVAVKFASHNINWLGVGVINQGTGRKGVEALGGWHSFNVQNSIFQGFTEVQFETDAYFHRFLYNLFQSSAANGSAGLRGTKNFNSCLVMGNAFIAPPGTAWKAVEVNSVNDSVIGTSNGSVFIANDFDQGNTNTVMMSFYEGAFDMSVIGGNRMETSGSLFAHIYDGAFDINIENNHIAGSSNIKSAVLIRVDGGWVTIKQNGFWDCIDAVVFTSTSRFCHYGRNYPHAGINEFRMESNFPETFTWERGTFMGAGGVVSVGSGGKIGISPGTSPDAAPDAFLTRVQANHLAMLNGLTNQDLSIYSRHDGTNFQRFRIQSTDNEAILNAERFGTNYNKPSMSIRVGNQFQIWSDNVLRYLMQANGDLLPGTTNQQNLGNTQVPFASASISKIWINHTNNVFIMAGNGSPQGLIPGGVGSMWIRLDGAPGEEIYFKTASTDETGWLPRGSGASGINLGDPNMDALVGWYNSTKTNIYYTLQPPIVFDGTNVTLPLNPLHLEYTPQGVGIKMPLSLIVDQIMSLDSNALWTFNSFPAGFTTNNVPKHNSFSSGYFRFLNQSNEYILPLQSYALDGVEVGKETGIDIFQGTNIFIPASIVGGRVRYTVNLPSSLNLDSLTVNNFSANNAVFTNAWMTNSLKFNFPRYVDGAGCTIPNTNNFTTNTFMVPLFSATAASNANFMRFGVRVPEDLATNVAIRAKLSVELTGADTAAHEYHVGMVSVANSASINSTPANYNTITISADASGGELDMEASSSTTLTGWAPIPGQWWVIDLRRAGAVDASTVASRFRELEILYGSNQ